MMTDEEIDALGLSPAPAGLTFSTVDISQKTTGLDESLGFNIETGQHTVATPGLTSPRGVLGSFNFVTGMYNNFAPPVPSDVPASDAPTVSVGTSISPGAAPGAGGQAP